MSAFIDVYRDRFGLERIVRPWMCRRPRTYQPKTGERSERGVEDERLTGRIQEVHVANYECYGYQRVHAELAREGGYGSRLPH